MQLWKQITWLPGTTQLGDWGHIPSLTRHQLTRLNNGELGWALYIPAERVSNPGVHALVCPNVDRVPVTGSQGASVSKTQTRSLLSQTLIPIKQASHTHTRRYQVGKVPGREAKQGRGSGDGKGERSQERRAVAKGLSQAETRMR